MAIQYLLPQSREFDRIGFKAKSYAGHMADFKARCAKLGRMDLYRAVDTHHYHVGHLSMNTLLKISAEVISGHAKMRSLEAYVEKIGLPHARPERGNDRYVSRALQSARSVADPGSCRGKAADKALALPELFPDD